MSQALRKLTGRHLEVENVPDFHQSAARRSRVRSTPKPAPAAR
jgi:hypothetical protein